MNAKDIRTPPNAATAEETGAVAEPGAGTAGARSNDRLLDSLESLLGGVVREGPERVDALLAQLLARIRERQRAPVASLNTPYLNTIPREQEPSYPGDRRIERQVKSYVRWNAMAMVVKANRFQPGIGGHISTYASAANLYEVALNHFLRGGDDGAPGDACPWK